MLAALLCFAGYSQAQITFNGHTYVELPPLSRPEAVAAANALGGYICKLETNEEFYFIDANFVKRGTGWWWTSVTAQPYTSPSGVDYITWLNDDQSLLSNVYYLHWNPNQYTAPSGVGSYVVMGKFQIFPRSTKWITKFGNFSKEFGDGTPKPSIVEIE